jgi:hypothetical protein
VKVLPRKVPANTKEKINKIRSEFHKTLALPLTSQKFYTHAKSFPLLVGQANKLWLGQGKDKTKTRKYVIICILSI